jgi:outer membrane protein
MTWNRHSGRYGEIYIKFVRMSTKRLLPLTLYILFFNLAGRTQDKWDLKRCVDYAVNNNISVKQADVQARIAKLTLGQSKWAQIPTLAFSTGLGVNSGYTLNPTSFSLNTTTTLYNNYSLQSSIVVYNGLYLRHIIDANRYAWQAALENSEFLKNNIVLNVANAYLSVLVAVQQTEASRLQLRLSQNQLDITRKQVKAGTVPELNAAELESQVATDSSTYITSVGNVEQSVLTLKGYMDLDAAVPFEVETPPVEQIPIDSLSDLQPEAVYTLALAHQPQQKFDALQIKSYEYLEKAAKGAMYPTVSIGGSMSTNYINLPQTSIVYTPAVVPVGYVEGTNAKVYDSTYIPSYANSNVPYFKQLHQYFSQTVGLTVSIPILNQRTLRTAYEKSKLNLLNQELQRDQDNLTLKQNVYQAYTSAVTAQHKLEATKIALATTQKSFEYAQKRYNVGMLNTIDLLTNQNNYFNARINLISAQFNYVFAMKVLEYYKGLGVKLTKE